MNVHAHSPKLPPELQLQVIFEVEHHTACLHVCQRWRRVILDSNTCILSCGKENLSRITALWFVNRRLRCPRHDVVARNVELDLDLLLNGCALKEVDDFWTNFPALVGGVSHLAVQFTATHAASLFTALKTPAPSMRRLVLEHRPSSNADYSGLPLLPYDVCTALARFRSFPFSLVDVRLPVQVGTTTEAIPRFALTYTARSTPGDIFLSFPSTTWSLVINCAAGASLARAQWLAMCKHFLHQGWLGNPSLHVADSYGNGLTTISLSYGLQKKRELDRMTSLRTVAIPSRYAHDASFWRDVYDFPYASADPPPLLPQTVSIPCNSFAALWPALQLDDDLSNLELDCSQLPEQTACPHFPVGQFAPRRLRSFNALVITGTGLPPHFNVTVDELCHLIAQIIDVNVIPAAGVLVTFDETSNIAHIIDADGSQRPCLRDECCGGGPHWGRTDDCAVITRSSITSPGAFTRLGTSSSSTSSSCTQFSTTTTSFPAFGCNSTSSEISPPSFATTDSSRKTTSKRRAASPLSPVPARPSMLPSFSAPNRLPAQTAGPVPNRSCPTRLEYRILFF
ncbi:hypothetical protein EXIGLDRAFT_707783 [Exidia glandulosa HHB12029]|uniref:F-box domain-containing protein n=1 Tax=Exidia glandulosa HHB12029 TaxID=1314781 RepID=A0A166NEW3_EXIGL|nr:hypothetical protein EXIGLDRAFT_707783 [Exidia glandulosa HHB12029]